MLPNAHRQPTGPFQALVSVTIPTAVCLDLVAPKAGVGRGPRRMYRTTVPKAAIDEHGDPGLREHYVGPPSPPGDRTGVDPVAKAEPMKLGPQLHLWCGVTLPRSFHAPMCVIGRRKGDTRPAFGHRSSLLGERIVCSWWARSERNGSGTRRVLALSRLKKPDVARADSGVVGCLRNSTRGSRFERTGHPDRTAA